MVLAYDSIDVGGTIYRIDSVGVPIEGKSGTGGDAAKVAGVAAAGAILGKIIAGSRGDAAKGAVIGGAASTAASLATRGPDPKISAGQTVTIKTDQGVTVNLSFRLDAREVCELHGGDSHTHRDRGPGAGPRFHCFPGLRLHGNASVTSRCTSMAALLLQRATR